MITAKSISIPRIIISMLILSVHPAMAEQPQNFTFGGVEYKKVTLFKHNKKTGEIQLLHSAGVKSVYVDKLNSDQLERLGIEVTGSAEDRMKAKEMSTKRLRERVAQSEQQLREKETNQDTNSLGGTPSSNLPNADNKSSEELKAERKQKMEELVRTYESVENLPLLDLMASSRKFDLIKKHQGQTVLAKIGSKTLNYERGDDKTLAWVSQYKGYRVWIKNSSYAGKAGYYKATIPSLFPWLSSTGNSSNYNIMTISTQVHPSLKFIEYAKKAKAILGK